MNGLRVLADEVFREQIFTHAATTTFEYYYWSPSSENTATVNLPFKGVLQTIRDNNENNQSRKPTLNLVKIFAEKEQ